MRRAGLPPRISGAVVSGAVLCGTLSGCGTGEAIYTDVSLPAERAKILALLGDLPGLPDGFSVRPRDGWQPPFRSADENCRLALDAAAGRPPAQDMRTHAEVSFHGAGLGEVAGAGVTSYGGGAGASFDRLGDALEDCAQVAGWNAGKGTRFASEELPIAGVGDDTVARRLTGRLNGFPYEMHLVFVRAGETLISVVHAGVNPPDPVRTEQLAGAVTAKMTGQAE
ncbi:hypothetical protein Misp01_37370 [Microtetraspora sp. NBRC 13810]|uniref:hypothetical protein n=1 Tax=Microtetraspora sp. NBRC 13810 TaxID=3030990 RepID=UPI0024A4628D|nr:hypothetical protein [Microtetraspora sp. NBRC 13810]GLW08607.1 hypothetical protein Misp01_37370 [Microtetraspora sp. NBRC 13810]